MGVCPRTKTFRVSTAGKTSAISTKTKSMSLIEIEECDRIICRHKNDDSNFFEGKDGDYSISLLSIQICPSCGASGGLKLSCRRSGIIISRQEIDFCYVSLYCSSCGLADCFRPDPEIHCPRCKLEARFNLPSSTWAKPWECNRWM